MEDLAGASWRDAYGSPTPLTTTTATTPPPLSISVPRGVVNRRGGHPIDESRRQEIARFTQFFKNIRIKRHGAVERRLMAGTLGEQKAHSQAKWYYTRQN